MKDHDQRFKTLIREFGADLLRLFFANWAERLELDTIEWLDKEVLPNPPDGSRHLLDMVARIQIKSQIERVSNEQAESTLALIHIEIESPDRTTVLKPRLPSYYVHLRDTYSLPVLPIVIYLKVGLDGIGTDIYTECFWELETLRFSYLYVGLLALDGLKYVKGDNWLGVALAALMQIPHDKIVELGTEALRRLSEAPLTEQQKFLLAECVESYLPLDPQQQKELERRLSDRTLEKVQAMNKTTYEKGFEKGIEKGIEKGTQNTLLRLGTKQFGSASPELESRIREINDLTRLEELIDRLPMAQSWDDLLRVDGRNN